MCARDDMMRSSIANCRIRSQQPNLSKAWNIFCKSRRVDTRKTMTDQDKQLLEWCRQNSVQPLKSGLEDLIKPFEDWSPYMMYPPDRLHTLIGVLSMYVSKYCVILLKISILPQYRGTKYSDGIGKLDELIKKFPHSQSMPVKTKRFGSGISIYIPSLLDQKTKVTGYGHIGLIDSEDIPLLFLQVLFCKHFFI
jgi:hypothetical protein